MSSGTSDKVEGKVQQGAGTIEKAAGDATNDADLKRRGMMDEAEGKGKEIAGEAKNIAEDMKDKVTDMFKKKDA
jgi:uncharacterized protein YjbJ (UPF0337 family)